MNVILMYSEEIINVFMYKTEEQYKKCNMSGVQS